MTKIKCFIFLHECCLMIKSGQKCLPKYSKACDFNIGPFEIIRKPDTLCHYESDSDTTANDCAKTFNSFARTERMATQHYRSDFSWTHTLGSINRINLGHITFHGAGESYSIATIKLEFMSAVDTHHRSVSLLFST